MKILFELQRLGHIEVYFGDETGFSLTPYIPYGWLPVGEQTSIETEKKNVMNLFGLLNVEQQQVFAYPAAKGQMINTDFMIQSIEDFIPRCQKPTVIILDNAPWHRSEAFLAKAEEWQEEDLYIFFLPSYSPHFNLIETLWRKMKYEWIRPKDYHSKTALRRRIKHIFDQFGSEFSINFSMNAFN